MMKKFNQAIVMRNNGEQGFQDAVLGDVSRVQRRDTVSRIFPRIKDSHAEQSNASPFLSCLCN